jgi:hypothetical protein
MGKKRSELQDNSSVPTGSLIEPTGDKALENGREDVGHMHVMSRRNGRTVGEKRKA